jgi:hypothetical protein
MGSIANYLENAALDHIFGTSALTQPSTYLALGVGADDTGLTAEVNGNNYARVAVSTAGGWEGGAAGVNRSTQNTGTITFNQASGTWGTPDSWAIYDAPTGGNPLAWGSITTPKLISLDDIPSFAAGEIQVAWDASVANNGWSDYVVNSFLDHVFTTTSYTAETLYVGFGTTPLTDSGTITGEASGGGYARTAHGVADAASGGITANTNAITFTVSGTWTADVDVIFVSNDLTLTAANNLLFFGTITAFSAVDGDTVEISAGGLTTTVS